MAFPVLAEEQKSSKWLAEQLGKDRATVSKWVTNTMQHLNNEGNRYYPTDKTWRGQ